MVSTLIEPTVWRLAFAGGLFIGLAAILLYATLGKIAGVSGIFFGGLLQRGGDRPWQLLFLAGLIAGGWIAVLSGLSPLAYHGQAIHPMLLALGGLTVGFGTRLGKGCTSGHGVCGLGRLSPRSLLAVIIFMLMGFMTATWLRPLLAGIYA